METRRNDTSTQDISLEGLASAMHRLERQNHMLRRCLWAPWLVLGVVLALTGFRGNRVVEAERFVLTDSQGHARATLEPTGQGCRLVMRDFKGRSMINMETRGIGPKIVFIGTQGKECADLAVNKGVALLSLYDEKNQRRRVTMIVDPDRSGLLITDQKESDRLSLLDTAAGPVMRMKGAIVVPASKK